MTTADDLLRAITAAIDDRTPRLVFADWLDDHGDPRAEWVRVECELADLGPKDARRPAREARQREVWDAHRDGLIGWERQFALARIRSKTARITADTALLRLRGEPHIIQSFQVPRSAALRRNGSFAAPRRTRTHHSLIRGKTGTPRSGEGPVPPQSGGTRPGNRRWELDTTRPGVTTPGADGFAPPAPDRSRPRGAVSPRPGSSR